MDFIEAVEHRDQPAGVEGFLGAGHQPPEDMDFGLHQFRVAGVVENLAQVNSFLDQGDEENSASGRGQRRGDAVDAEPVGVGLDYGGALGAVEAIGEQPVIGGDGVQVDSQNGTGVGFGDGEGRRGGH